MIPPFSFLALLGGGGSGLSNVHVADLVATNSPAANLIPTVDPGDTTKFKYVAAGGGAVTVISSQTLGSSATTFHFASIPNTYKMLKLILWGADTISAGFEAVHLQCNSDTNSGNYTNSVYQEAFNGSVSMGNQAPSSAGIIVGYIPGVGTNANGQGEIEIILPNYASTTAQKHIRAIASAILDASGATGNTAMDTRTGRYLSNTAISDLLVTCGGTAFAAGDTALLLGIG